ncbi:MAG: LiaI-LiaF-like domain-containing protein [Anaerolineae bacterium]
MTLRSPRRGSIVFPVLLIAAGVLLIGQNLGWIEWSLWQAAATLWPLVLVAIGLDLILTRANPWASAALVFALLVAAVAVWAAIGFGSPALVSRDIDVSLGGADTAELSISFDVGELRLRSGPPGSEKLVTGSARAPSAEEVAVSQSIVGETLAVSLQSQATGGRIVPFGGINPRQVWDLRLDPDVPVVLRVQVDLASAELDLTELEVEELTVDMDLGSGTILLPRRIAEGRAVIRMDLGRLVVIVPQGVAVRIRAQADLSSVDIDESRFPRRGTVYESSDYPSSSNRYQLDITADLASIRIQ